MLEGYRISICFENYSEKDKELMITRNLNAYKSSNAANLKNTEAKYFLPMGFFVEKAKRDAYVKQRNIKNKLKTIIRSVKIIIAHYSTSIRIKSLHLMVVI